jgi:hypothetical protein
VNPTGPKDHLGDPPSALWPQPRRVTRLTVIRRLLEAILAAGAAAALSHLVGCPDWLSLVAGVAMGFAAWRPPPAASFRSIPDLEAARRHHMVAAAYGSVMADTASLLDSIAGPGLDLGRVTVAPSQTVPLFAGRRFWLALDELDRHATLIGATGSGKTTTLGRLMDAAMGVGWAVLVVDAKGGRLANVCSALGAAHHVPTRIWLPGHPLSWTYDLCQGEPTSIGNRIVGAFDHGPDGQIYRNLSQALIPMAARSLLETGRACTLDTLRFSLDSAHLTGLARHVSDVGIKAELLSMVHDSLHQKTLSGLVGRLRTLRYGVFGPWLLPSDRTLNLDECLRTPGVTYMGLPATAASEDVALVGRIVIQHLKQLAYAALWSDQPARGLVVIDEFASIGEAAQLLDLLLQAREARLAVVISTQQLPRDLVLRKALLGAGTLMVHQVSVPDDARALAEALGTRAGTEIVRQIQLGPAGPLARRYLRSRESFLVSPDQLARLPIGQVAVCVRFAQQRIALVQVDPLRS